MRLVKWLIGFVITLGIVLAAVPLVAKWYLVKWLESQGYQAEIKKLGMDFIFGELSIQGATINSPREEQLSVFSARADFDLWILLRDGQMVVDRFEADSARIDMRGSAEGLRVGGFPLAPALDTFSERFPLEIRTARLINTDICRAAEQCLRMESISVSRAKWSNRGNGWEFVHSAPVIVEKVFLRDQSRNTTLFYGAHLNVNEGAYTAASIDVEDLILSNFQFVENSLGVAGMDSPYQTQLGEAKIASLKWRGTDPAELTLGAVDITSLRQSLHRTSDGTYMMPAQLSVLLDRSRWNKLHLVMEKLELRDGAVSWMDQAVTPPAMLNLSALSVQVGRIDSAMPDNPTSLVVSGKVGQEGKISLEGDIYPHSLDTKLTLSGFIQGLDLAKLAGYSRQFLNQGVDQGTVDVSVSAVARNGQLEADTRWEMANLRIEPTRGNSSDMPLELSYDLLKDHNNSISLELPVRGEFGSEHLKPQYIFARQMRRVMSDMARRRVNPAGAVATPARAVPTGKMAFRPLEYSANGRYPASADAERLQEVAAMLREKPHLRMVFCPVSTGGEWAELFNEGERPTPATELLPEHKDMLLELAKARGQVIRSRLIDAGAASDQIVICNPSVDMTQFGLSFVSISL
jgi:hypothetical protein